MTTPPPGIYPGIPDHEYHAWSALGSTSIKALATLPAGAYLYRQTHPLESAAFTLGRAAHSLILEGRKPDYVVNAPDRRAKAYKEAAQDADAEILLYHEWQSICRMRDSVMANTDAADLLTGHAPEVSLRWDEGDVPLKGRLDGWHEGRGIIVDLKTTRDASPRGFGRAAAEYGYHAQAALYHDGLSELTGRDHEYFIVAVEKTAPYLTAVYEVLPDQIDAGREIVRDGIAAYAEAKGANDWPTRYESQPLYLPMWAYPDMEMEMP